MSEREWGLLDVRWFNTPTGCEHCGRAIKRAHLVEETASGRRLWVGRQCLRHFGLK
jgi:hypothetical protein